MIDTLEACRKTPDARLAKCLSPGTSVRGLVTSLRSSEVLGETAVSVARDTGRDTKWQLLGVLATSDGAVDRAPDA